MKKLIIPSVITLCFISLIYSSSKLMERNIKHDSQNNDTIYFYLNKLNKRINRTNNNIDDLNNRIDDLEMTTSELEDYTPQQQTIIIEQ